jgi:hypothetical protein
MCDRVNIHTLMVQMCFVSQMQKKDFITIASLGFRYIRGSFQIFNFLLNM